MPTLTLQKPSARKVTVEINLDQWERLADVFGFYQPNFIKATKKSLKESRSGETRKIESLRELESKQ